MRLKLTSVLGELSPNSLTNSPLTQGGSKLTYAASRDTNLLLLCTQIRIVRELRPRDVCVACVLYYTPTSHTLATTNLVSPVRELSSSPQLTITLVLGSSFWTTQAKLGDGSASLVLPRT